MREKIGDPDLYNLYASIIIWVACSIASPMTRESYMWISVMPCVFQTEFCVQSAVNVQLPLIVAQASISDCSLRWCAVTYYYCDVCVTSYVITLRGTATLADLSLLPVLFETNITRDISSGITGTLCWTLSIVWVKSYTPCFKKSFTTSKEYTDLFREHTQCFEVSECSKTHQVLPRIVMVRCDFHW
jgi:hypothetical protein